MIIHRPKDCVAGFICRADPNDSLPFLELGEIHANPWTDVKPHSNKGWELCLQAKGSSKWEVEGKPYKMPELGCYLIRSGVTHRALNFSGEDCHFYFVVIPDERIPEEVADRPEWDKDCQFTQSSPEMLIPFQSLVREVSIPKKWRRFSCKLFIQQLCIAFSRIHLKKSDARESWLELHPAAVRTMTLLSHQPDYPWRTEELAKLAGISVPHLCQIFRKAYGETPYQCLMRLRIEEAKRRLSDTDMSITHIAVDLCFASGQHFSRIFKQRTGITPRQYRKINAPDSQ
ncbi:MAG: helix-turn-helix domain-containing protein [Opitutales bacterium]|nr:helix-turn-helix domain-containing protein [Opitutales bacterium]